MTTRRLLALLCAAVVGVLLVVGLLVTALLGARAAAVYAVLAVALLVVGAVRGRRLLAPPTLPEGRTCTCCTTSHTDPVQVV